VPTMIHLSAPLQLRGVPAGYMAQTQRLQTAATPYAPFAPSATPADLAFDDDEPARHEPGIVGRLEGKACPWGTCSEFPIVRGLPGVIRAGAFQACRAVLSYDHDKSMEYGDYPAIPVNCTPKYDGLWMNAELPNTREGRFVRRLFEMGLVVGLSIAARVPPENCREKGCGIGRRIEVTGGQLVAISLVTKGHEPAFPKTSCRLVPA
jgi:hypothetical protein